MEGNLANEVGLIVLDTIELFCGHFKVSALIAFFYFRLVRPQSSLANQIWMHHFKIICLFSSFTWNKRKVTISWWKRFVLLLYLPWFRNLIRLVQHNKQNFRNVLLCSFQSIIIFFSTDLKVKTNVICGPFGLILQGMKEWVTSLHCYNPCVFYVQVFSVLISFLQIPQSEFMMKHVFASLRSYINKVNCSINTDH